VLHRVRATVRRYGMLSGGEVVVVAVSGGPDSMALLHILRRLQQEFRLRMHVVHVNHGLHRAAAAHAAFVARTARAWGLPVTVRRVNARAVARRHRMTLEEAARRVRYDALEKLAGRLGASHIAVGHTADDQVETLLLWLLRGASSDGLAGMPAVRPLGRARVIRPLIDLWRAEVLAYLASERVPFRVDPTNRLSRPLRNRIRRDLLPHLEGYNPGIKAVLRRLADQVADDAAWLGRQAAEAYARVVGRGRGGITVDVAGFRALPASLQRRVAHLAVAAAGGNMRALAFVHIERLREMASRDRPGEQADLPGVRARRRDATILLVRAAKRPLHRMLE